MKEYKFNPSALAIVRDDAVYSQLVEVSGPGKDKETSKIFSFHFKEDLDNSGFVGWLASIIKKELGTGVFVVCGQNKKKGGIFDYWGCPVEVANDVMMLIAGLRE